MYPPDCTVRLLCPPIGPGEPFGTPLVTALDVVRILVVLGALYVIALSALAISKIRSPKQRAVYLALIVIMIGIMGTEIDHLGDYAHYRLAVFVLGVVAAAYGMGRSARHVVDWAGPQTRRRRASGR